MLLATPRFLIDFTFSGNRRSLIALPTRRPTDPQGTQNRNHKARSRKSKLISFGMASDTQDCVEQKLQPQPKIQIYSTPSSEISPFWREKYEREAKKYWDNFYKRHQDRFFKDRHYLDKEWGDYFSGAGEKVVLEVGCGAGNTIFPLVATYPDIFIHACDFSPRAVNLVKMRKDFIETRVNAFVCDLTADDLSKQISPSSVDIVTMIFVLSAVSPEKMSLVLQNIKKVLKPNGCVLFRDYASGDLAQERLASKDQKISDNFYVRGDGTQAFYFSNEFLTSLVKENGFDMKEQGLCCKQVKNRSREIVMNRYQYPTAVQQLIERRWVQAVFHLNGVNKQTDIKLELPSKESSKPGNNFTDPAIGSEIDMSEGVAVEMFGISNSDDEHTCKSTGLMLWESAQLMASILVANQSIVAAKRVLELGCGCGGICSMISTKAADFVVATDRDEKALELLCQNVASNLQPYSQAKLIVKRLEWGNRDHIKAIKELNDVGFEVILGTDVTYVAETITPLFATAKELLSSSRSIKEEVKPALILCHVLRRVDEPSILSAAFQFDFRLVDRWPEETSTVHSQSIISSWFTKNREEECIPNTALNIMYFTTD